MFMACSSSDGDVNAPEVILTNDNTNNMMDNTNMPPDDVNLYKGSFVSGAHTTTGEAIVNEEHTMISFSDFKTDNGPLLEVYLATSTNATDYISLGVLQGVEGNFSYALPEGINFETHKFVLIWCVEFSVNFGHAVLE